MSLVEKVKARRRAVWESSKALLDAVEAQNRDFTGEENQTWTRHMSDLDDLDERIQELDDARQRQHNAENAFNEIQRRPPVAGYRPSLDRELDMQFRDAILRRSPAPIETRDPSPRSGYSPALEYRDLVTTTGSGMLGVAFHGQIVRHLVESAAILAAGATVLSSETGEDLKVPRSTAHSSAGIVAEGATIPESDPTLGSVTLSARKYGFLVQVSHELANDAAFDLLAYLAEQTGIAIANGAGAHFVTGTGTGQPRGVVTDATMGATGATGVGGKPSYDNLVDLYHSVASPYARSRAAGWLLNNGTLGEVRKIKDTNGNPIFDVEIPPGTGASGTLLGRPVYVDPNVATVGVSAKSILFGDFSRYWVRQVNGLRFDRSDDFAFDRDLVTFRGLARLDGAMVDTSAVKHFAGGAS